MSVLKKIVISAVIFLLSAGYLFSQEDFRDGYIVTISKDTIKGQIDYRNDQSLSANCKFRKSKNSQVENYSPGEIIAYRFNDGRYFISQKIDESDFFLEFITKGIVSIYYLRKDDKDVYFLENDELGLTEIKYSEKLITKNGRDYLLPSRSHIEILKIAMNDLPKIHSDIEKIKILTHQSLIKLNKKYHNKLNKKNELIVFDRKLQKSKFTFELNTGIINFKKFSTLIDKNYINTGVIVHYNMPRLNDKLYIRTGFILSKLDFENEEILIRRIPIHIEYIYSQGFIKPRLSYGLNINVPYIDNAVSVTGGFAIGLSKRIDIAITSEIDFRAFALFLPRSFLASSFQVGCVVNFDK